MSPKVYGSWVTFKTTTILFLLISKTFYYEKIIFTYVPYGNNCYRRSN
jgi:hypothetical protein